MQKLAQYAGAKSFDERDRLSFTRELTIDSQDTIAATPDDIYWAEKMIFDLSRTGDGVVLTFTGYGDSWLSLKCTDALATRIRQARDPGKSYSRFLFLFRLTQAVPLRVALRGQSEGDGENADLSVAADDIQGRAYTGTLVDVSLLDAGRGR